VPSQLCIARSGISGAGYGVWTRVPLANGLRFGPYEGVKVESTNPMATVGRWEVIL